MATQHQPQLHRPEHTAADQFRPCQPIGADVQLINGTHLSTAELQSISLPGQLKRAKDTTLCQQKAKELRATPKVCPPEGHLPG